MSFTVMINGSTISSAALNGNFYHVAQGDFLPMGGTTMTPTTGVYNLGSLGNHWRRLYVNEIAGNTVTVSAPMTFTGLVYFNTTTSFPSGILGYGQRVFVQEIQPTGTAAGAGTTGAYYKRIFTTITSTLPGASMTSGQISLPSGTYVCTAWGTGAGLCGMFKIRLQNITASTTVDVGCSVGAPTGANISGKSMLYTRFTLATSSVVEIQQRLTSNPTSTTLGEPVGQELLTQMKELYAEAEFLKIG